MNKQLTPETKRKLFGMTFEEYLEALADNREELESLRLPADSYYYATVAGKTKSNPQLVEIAPQN